MTDTISWTSGNAEGILNKTPITLPKQNIDGSTSLSLLGTGVQNYGPIEQQNFIRLLENFASANQPVNPTIGQLWYHATDCVLYMCVEPSKVTGLTIHYPNNNNTLGWVDVSSPPSSQSVVSALGYTPYPTTNPNGYITGITSSNVTTALGYTPYPSTNPYNYISSITYQNVITALGFTPYSASNPNSYTTKTYVDTQSVSSLVAGANIAVSSAQGNVTVSVTGTVPNATNAANAASATTAGSAGVLTGPAHTNGTDGWFRSAGTAGWYSDTYAVGIYSTSAGLVQTYNNASFRVNGTLYVTGDIAAFYSDIRLKTKTGNIENALDKVDSLSGFYYKENELAKSLGANNDSIQVGVSAQDVEAVMPEVVSLAPIDMADDMESSKSGEAYKTVKYERLVPLLIEAIKELRLEVSSLRDQLNKVN